MKNSPPYFFLSGLFFAAYLVVQFTAVYYALGWFKFFALIVTIAFFSGGIAQRRNSQRSQENNNK
ncbi:MAG: hypothetical protein AAF519_20975 [Bacteroidota bacterium]